MLIKALLPALALGLAIRQDDDNTAALPAATAESYYKEIQPTRLTHLPPGITSGPTRPTITIAPAMPYADVPDSPVEGEPSWRPRTWPPSLTLKITSTCWSIPGKPKDYCTIAQPAIPTPPQPDFAELWCDHIPPTNDYPFQNIARCWMAGDACDPAIFEPTCPQERISYWGPGFWEWLKVRGFKPNADPGILDQDVPVVNGGLVESG